MTRPSRTTPGNPIDTRSNPPSGATSPTSASTSTFGGAGAGVATRSRSVIIPPRGSSTEAFSPVPPTSMASVLGRAVARPRPAAAPDLFCISSS
jgi:hypothetical protein